ncbi:MAG: NB-ARC domain-containing protein [Pseudonocardia sp.]
MGTHWPWGLQWIRENPFLSAAALTVVMVGLGASTWWMDRRIDHLAEVVPAVEQPEPWVVDRPAQVAEVVAALRRTGGATVGITTALQGAGGFGKTTIAKLIRADRRVLRHFGRRVFWVTLGRDVRTQADIANKVNDLIKRIDPSRDVTFTDPQQAGAHLKAVLDVGPRRLVILDDVWHPEQLEPFRVGGRRSALLVTTRIPTLVAGRGVPITIDQPSAEQAKLMLTWCLPSLPAAQVEALLVETGRWPLLLRLVNKVLAAQARTSVDLTGPAEEVRQRLREYGALAIDELTGEAVAALDVADPDARQRAVRATIEASTALLSRDDRTRFTELGIFAEDETIPISLVATLWNAKAGMDGLGARQLCARLDELALLSLTPAASGGTVSVHDVVRDWMRAELGPQEAALHAAFLDAAASDLPTARPPDHDDIGSATRWWTLGVGARYLWEHVIEHMLAAGRLSEAEVLATDLRWVAARIDRFGPVAPLADLVLLNTPRCVRMSRVLTQAAHLLEPTEPPHALRDILCSRVAHDPDWRAQANKLARESPHPGLFNQWPPPDLPDPDLRRILTGHTNGVRAVAVAPDGSWLASAGADATVRIWDVATGRQRSELTGHTSGVWAVAVAPDGSWLASASDDHTVRIWSAMENNTRHMLRIEGEAHSCAWLPNNAGVAVGGTAGLYLFGFRTGQAVSSVPEDTGSPNP